ncbi:HD-GYP domain-containing protein, partial [Actinomadura viridis]|uniref:HD-GYP domain-containing protein n=1 Tax=Actinomadura viridis TaxID=58110 RepID=UPI00367A869E
ARVISVADAFDSMTSTRSYRPARTVEEAVEELRRGVGDHFDPGMVEAFLRALERDGWEPPKPVVLPDDDIVETTQQDHDDPSTPIRVAGEDDDRTGDRTDDRTDDRIDDRIDDGTGDDDRTGDGHGDADAAGESGAARDTARR